MNEFSIKFEETRLFFNFTFLMAGTNVLCVFLMVLVCCTHGGKRQERGRTLLEETCINIYFKHCSLLKIRLSSQQSCYLKLTKVKFVGK